MTTTPPLRLLVVVQTTEEGTLKFEFHKKPHSAPSEGGPPEILHHKGVQQIIITHEEFTMIYRWVEFPLIPDPELVE